jgi:dephospho-CoA kinase
MDREKGIRRKITGRSLVGITGGIGSGKSRVCRFLARQYRFPVIDLDAICKQLLMPEESGWLALRDILPVDFFCGSGALDRKAFRDALFSDSALRNRVDAVLHPLARLEMEKQVARVFAVACPVLPVLPVLVEIPLLFEAGWQDDVQLIVVVYADIPVRLQRIIQRDQISEEQAGKAVDAQRCLTEKASLADYVIDNSGGWRHTCTQLRQLVGALGCG